MSNKQQTLLSLHSSVPGKPFKLDACGLAIIIHLICRKS
jgi:hypothetical protein